MNRNLIKNLTIANIIALGLLMLVPGLFKLLVSGPQGVSAMMSGIFLFSWAPMIWAWILIVLEIGIGIAILSKWELKYSTKIAAFILLIATLTVAVKWSALGQTSWGTVLFHFIAIFNYLILGLSSRN